MIQHQQRVDATATATATFSNSNGAERALTRAILFTLRRAASRGKNLATKRSRLSTETQKPSTQPTNAPVLLTNTHLPPKSKHQCTNRQTNRRFSSRDRTTYLEVPRSLYLRGSVRTTVPCVPYAYDTRNFVAPQNVKKCCCRGEAMNSFASNSKDRSRLRPECCLELARLRHLLHNVQSSQKLATRVQLRNAVGHSRTS